jgi:putative ABC transport system permease protein
MNILLRAWSILIVAAKRLLAQRGLALATLLGLVAAVALTTSIPLYAEAVYYRVLSEGFFEETTRYRDAALRPPAVLLFRYVGSITGPVQWETLQPLDTYFDYDLYRDLRLPPSPDARQVRMFNSGILGIFAAADAEVVTTKPPLFYMSLATITDLEQHLTVVEGRYPAESVSAADAESAGIEVLLSRAFADRMGIQAGETYLAYDLRAQHKYEANPALFWLHIVGIWEQVDADEEFWNYSQVPPQNLIFVPQASFAETISPALEDEIYQALWYLPLDASGIHVSDVVSLLDRLQDLQQRVAGFLPNTILDVSPKDVLTRYRESANRLTILLLAFNVPLATLILAFVILMITLVAERQRSDVAMLRSRGATTSQVAGISALEGLLLGALALAAALPVSLLLAYTIGQTRSFLDFSLATDLRVGLTWASARYGVVVTVLTLIALIVPVLGNARHTIVTYKQERARTLRPPWWQRFWLDALLLIPAGYGTYILGQQGSLLRDAANIPTDPFQDPLLFLVPALSVCAFALFLLRLFPLMMRVLAWLAAQTRSVGLLLAMRQLSRASGFYAAPLGLLVVTLSLSAYTASLAATLDNHLWDQQQFQVGADVSLVDLGDDPQSVLEAVYQPTSQTFWSFAPVTEYIKVPGIADATRVGRYKAQVRVGDSHQTGIYLGVDRVDLARIAYWRRDFAPEPLGALMNHLAARQDGVLLPHTQMQASQIEVGDRVEVVINAFGQSAAVPLIVVGSFDLFPTWYPDEPDTGWACIGNLDYLFDQAMTQMPYQVWLKTSSDVDYDRLRDRLFGVSPGAQRVLAARPRILKEQGRPERQGLLGLLSVGFSAAALLTALGFTLYALFTFRRRQVELGVMRAMGMSSAQMAVYVICELGFLLLIGGAAGTGLGVLASHVYIPTLQIGAEATARVPPFVVEIAWPAILRVYALFGGLYLVALALLVRSLLRMRLFDAIKLGETV